jgi:hypothetical protein
MSKRKSNMNLKNIKKGLEVEIEKEKEEEKAKIKGPPRSFCQEQKETRMDSPFNPMP